MNKKVLLGIFASMATLSFVVPAMARDSLLDENLAEINSYMNNVVNYTHNPFSTNNVLNEDELSAMNLVKEQNNINDELSIIKYSIDDCQLVYNLKDNFFTELNNNRVVIDKNDYFWYQPAVNQEGNPTLLAFVERNGNIQTISVEIAQDNTKIGLLSELDVQSLLNETGDKWEEVEYFNLPLPHESVVCAHVVGVSGEDYIIVVDKSLSSDYLELGYPYSIEEFSDIIATIY